MKKGQKTFFEHEIKISGRFFAVLKTWHDDCFIVYVRPEGFRFWGQAATPEKDG
jgi:hypothetical protein